MWIKFSVNPPPANVDILVKLADGTCAVGRKDENGVTEPVNVHSTYDGAGGVTFNSKPVAWDYLPG